MESQEIKKKLEKIQSATEILADKYRGNVKHGEMEKEQMLRDFQLAFAESEKLKSLFEEAYENMPDSFRVTNRYIYEYIVSIGLLASTVAYKVK